MWRRFAVASTFCFALTVSAMSAVAPAKFGGIWVLDKSRSRLVGIMSRVESLTWTIAQNAKTISIVNNVSAGGQHQVQKLTYNLDGSQTTAELGSLIPGKATLRAKWLEAGKTLQLISMTNISLQGQDFGITAIDRIQLSEGGKVLLVNRTLEGPQGIQESKLVFVRK
jgi:hypothetical protein